MMIHVISVHTHAMPCQDLCRWLAWHYDHMVHGINSLLQYVAQMYSFNGVGPLELAASQQSGE